MVCRLGDMMSEYGSFTLWVCFSLNGPLGKMVVKRTAMVREHSCTRDDARAITETFRKENPDFKGDLSGEWVMRDSF